jgi:type I restriction enzyme S subunit
VRNEDLPPGFHQTSLGPLPQGWEVVSFGSVVLRSFSGGTPSTKRPDYWNGGVPWITSAYIAGLYVLKGAKSITQAGLDHSASRLVPRDNLLVGTRVGVGKVAINKIDIAISQDLTGLIIDKEQAHLEFLAYALSSSAVQRIFVSATRGTTIKGIPRDDLLRIVIPLPPLPEQRAIASVLRAVQRAIEATVQVIAAARELKRSLMRHLFTYGPMTVEQAETVALQDTEAGRIPQDWQARSLGEIVAQGKGMLVSGPFGSNIGKRFFVQEGVPLIRGNNLTTGQAVFLDAGFVYITEEKAHELAYCTALPDDVIFTAAGTIGQVGLIPRTCRYPKYIISNKQIRARTDTSQTLPLFLFYWFTHDRMQRLFQKRRRGTSIPVINLGIVQSLPVGLPSIHEQLVIVEALSGIDRKIAVEEARKASLGELFKTLLHHLMTGQVRVPVENAPPPVGATGRSPLRDRRGRGCNGSADAQEGA